MKKERPSEAERRAVSPRQPNIGKAVTSMKGSMNTTTTEADKICKHTIPPAKRKSEELYRRYEFNGQSMQKLTGSLRDTEQLGAAEKRRMWYSRNKQRRNAFAVNGSNYNTTHDITYAKKPPSIKSSIIVKGSVNAVTKQHADGSYHCATPLDRNTIEELVMQDNLFYCETPGEYRGSSVRLQQTKRLVNWSATSICTGNDISCALASTAISGDAVEGGGARISILI